MIRGLFSLWLCCGLLSCQKNFVSTPATPSSGLRVPLPQGWNLKTQSSSVFMAGPAGKPVLRLEVIQNSSIARPSLGAWKASVSQSVAGVQFLEEEASPQFISLRFQSSDSKPGWLGAALKDTFWVGCSVMGGASEEEWRLAKQACAGVEWVELLRPTEKH